MPARNGPVKAEFTERNERSVYEVIKEAATTIDFVISPARFEQLWAEVEATRDRMQPRQNDGRLELYYKMVEHPFFAPSMNRDVTLSTAIIEQLDDAITVKDEVEIEWQAPNSDTILFDIIQLDELRARKIVELGTTYHSERTARG